MILIAHRHAIYEWQKLSFTAYQETKKQRLRVILGTKRAFARYAANYCSLDEENKNKNAKPGQSVQGNSLGAEARGIIIPDVKIKYSDVDDVETEPERKVEGDVEVIPHTAMDWEGLAKRSRRCTNWMKQEVGLILTTIFLLYLLRAIFVAMLEADQPYFMVLNVTSQPTFFASINEDNSSTNDEQAIKETLTVTGTEAVRRFRSHLQCFRSLKLLLLLLHVWPVYFNHFRVVIMELKRP